MNKNPTGLSPKTISALKGIFSQYNEVKKVILYGSRAKGNYREGSDIDLSLIAPKLKISDLSKIENKIEDLNLPYKVDLSLHHQIENEDLLEHIARVGIEFS